MFMLYASDAYLELQGAAISVLRKLRAHPDNKLKMFELFQSADQGKWQTRVAVQQLFTLTPAVAASQGATPKAKSSAKAAATASTPGTDMDTAAAVQQLFTLVLSVGRMYLQRSKFTKLRKATVGLQTAFRGYIAKKSYKFTVSQIVKVQSVGRMRLKRGSNHISPVALGGGAAATKLLRFEQPAPGECACDLWRVTCDV